MKLLKLEIGELPKEKQFRSLHSGFKVELHNYNTKKGLKAMESFSPFCFAGLNGSGKSNVLEALSSIFFHIECCVAKFRPQSFENHFRRHECNPDAFILEYLIGQHNSKGYTLENYDKITIIKEEHQEPLMFRQRYPFSKEDEMIPVSLLPKLDLREPQPAEGKDYLPQIIVGYSSGENEILSLPFRKSRLINFDKFSEDYIKKYRFEEPENSLIYVDADMSQAVLLSCLLYENKDTLKPFKKELGIVGLRSFRMNIKIFPKYNIATKKQEVLIQHITDKLEELKKCASSWNTFTETFNGSHGGSYNTNLILDFYVDQHTKKLFKDCFETSFDFFRFLQVLYELNAINVTEKTKEDVYGSKGFYTDWKIPSETPENNVFSFEDFYILKKIKGESNPKPLLLREFSDGEHQFIHTMGICLLLKERKSLLFLDEPETHFNPSWRAKFIKILDDSIKAGNSKKHPNDSFNIHSLKDILLTSHSPFIISDCLPNNVILFDRESNSKKVQARKATELGLNTYGTSVEIILNELFNYNQSIGDLSNDILTKIDFDSINTPDEVAKTKKMIRHLGDSIEKDIVLARLNNKLPPEDLNSNNNPIGTPINPTTSRIINDNSYYGFNTNNQSMQNYLKNNDLTID